MTKIFDFNLTANYDLCDLLLFKQIENFKNINGIDICRASSDKISKEKIASIFSEIVDKSMLKEIINLPSIDDSTSGSLYIYKDYLLYLKNVYRTSFFNVVLFVDNNYLPLDKINLFKEQLNKYSTEIFEEIDWYYSSRNGISSVTFPLNKRNNFYQESYPFIKNIEDWIDGFNSSKSNILILNGPVGTGKSTLLTKIISKGKYKTMTAFDEKVMKSDSLYIDFLTSTHNLLILEDADLYLLDRVKKDNDTMSKLLNVSEGIINTKHKKIIFTANLENIENIDKAVRRPGRCYDIVEFRELTFEEANSLRKIIDKPLFTRVKEYSLAEIYNK